jgi:hypothetical protein
MSFHRLLQQKAVDLLDMLQDHLPDKTGEKGKWNFEKAHNILHKVRKIVLWGIGRSQPPKKDQLKISAISF